jgi:NAD(P)-dependent dehydrogenase (short-subunit alcohol dehydrogenase family)
VYHQEFIRMSNIMEVKGKRVIVTGAAFGIGKAMTESFLESEAEVVIVDINEEALKQTAGDLNVEYITADVSSEDAIKEIISASNSFMGGIDIFCSNAGVAGAGGLLSTTEEDWLNIWGVNVMSHIYAAKHTLPQMLKQESGYFVNTASAAGLLTQIGAAGYSVTKAAAVSFAEWLKITYGNKGIGVSCLCPQGVRTSMVEDAPGIVSALVGIDGIMEPADVASDVIKAIEKDQFLIAPHEQVLDYIKMKAQDYDRWIGGMQSLQTQLLDNFPEANEMFK